MAGGILGNDLMVRIPVDEFDAVLAHASVAFRPARLKSVRHDDAFPFTDLVQDAKQPGAHGRPAFKAIERLQKGQEHLLPA